MASAQRHAENIVININGSSDAGSVPATAPPPGKAAGPKAAKSKTVAEHLGKQEEKFETKESFHTLHVRADHKEVLLEVKKSHLEVLFFHHLTFEGSEGNLPDMWDATPKATGLYFTWAPNRRDIQLVEAQQRLGDDDFAAPMYDSVTGGMLRGYVRLFTPLVNEEKEDGSVLLDLSSWLLAFGRYDQMGGRRQGVVDLELLLVGVSAFPENFLLRLSAQPGGSAGLPLKDTRDTARRTQYYTAGFCMLPKDPMVPRPFDRRVGYFTTPVLLGGASTATQRQHAICRWDLQRRQGRLLYCIDPAVPKAYHATLKRGVEAWNDAFEAAGHKGPVVCCVAKGDADWPTDYSRGDARFIAILMTEPQVPILGYGPSVVDFRSGEIVSASVLLGLQSFLEEASQYSLEVLDDPLRERLGCGSRLPLVDADHPDVLRTIFKTVIHEVGHTLGLRHNFIAAEDGNSSVMDYVDPLDTSDPSKPQYGGYFPNGVGTYDVYAVRYGYTRLDREVCGVRHPGLLLLANGQGLGENLDAEPHNPLFATDENVGGIDPRVKRWGALARRFGRDKLEFAIERRADLLERVERGEIFPETYTQRMLELINTSFRHVLSALGFVAGAEIDARRVSMVPCPSSDAAELLTTVVDFIVGATFRLSEAESKHFLSRYADDGIHVYRLAPADPLGVHRRLCQRIVDSLFAPERLRRLELQRLQAIRPDAQGEAGIPFSAYDLLMAFAFSRSGTSAGSRAVLDPFDPNIGGGDARAPERTAPSAEQLRVVGADPFLATARLALAETVANLQQKSQHATVRAGAHAFAQVVRQLIQPALKDLRPDVVAPWQLFLREMRPRRPTELSLTMPFPFFDGGKTRPRDRQLSGQMLSSRL